VQLASIEALMAIFYQFGDISSVRILRPSKEIPHDLRDVLGKSAESVIGISAVVEFETADAASAAFSRFAMKNDVLLEGINFEINVQLLGLESSSLLGDDDSGCGESASSGDESAPSGDLHHLIEDSNNLEEDYEKYMNEIRKERQTENKTNVPDVIAALMDEYGAGSTVPCVAPTAPVSSTKRPSPFEPFNVIGPVRSPSNRSRLWSSTCCWSSKSDEDENSEIQAMLADSALSAFGKLNIEDDVFSSETDGNFIAPEVSAPSQPPQTQTKWADAVRN